MALELKVDAGVAEAGMPEKLEEFRQLQKMCDVTLLSADGRVHKAHKVILSSRSEYFDQMWSSSFEEAKQSVVSLQEDPSILDEVLRYIYTGIVHITEDNGQDLLRVADQYGLPALFRAVEKHIIDNADADNCVLLLNIARHLNAKGLEERSWSLLEKDLANVSSFEELDKEDIIKLSKEEIFMTDFVPKFLAWFHVRSDVNTAMEVLQNLDFAQLDQLVIAQLNAAFANEMPCILVILQKMTKSWTCAKRGKIFDKPISYPLAQILWCCVVINSEKQNFSDTGYGRFGSFSVRRIHGNRVSVAKEGGEDGNFLVLFTDGQQISYAFCYFSTSDKTCELALTGDIGKSWFFSVYLGHFPSATLESSTTIGNWPVRNGEGQMLFSPYWDLKLSPPIVETENKEFSVTWDTLVNTVSITITPTRTKRLYTILFFMDGDYRHVHECDFSTSDQTTVSVIFDYFEKCEVVFF